MDEETLDPDDWGELRKLGHRMVDDMMDYLKNVRERPVWRPIPEEKKSKLDTPLPVSPESREDIYEEFKELVLPYPPGNIHPRFWGWVNGTGSPYGMLAEMLAAAMNANTGGREHMPKYVDELVIKWIKEMMGFSPEASGVLCSGCSEANFISLTVARNVMAGYDVRRQGIVSSDKPLVFYSSTSSHSSLQKAVELLGIGSDYYRKIPCNDRFEIDIHLLRQQIEEDIQAGLRPVCVIGTVGTVNTGAVDDIMALREIADEYNMWLHIDGAFGSLAILSEKYRHLVQGINSADSLAFDFHKWMHMPYTVACALIRSEEEHRQTFSLRPPYLAEKRRGIGSGGHWPTEYGLQLSRTFYALKVWFMLKENGIEKYGRLITQNIDQAKYAEQLVQNTPELEQLAPVKLNILCFRYRGTNLAEERLDEINEELLMRLHESGIAAPSYTTLDGKFALRIAITNHRSRVSDFELLMTKVVEIGNEIVESTMS